MSKIKEPNWLDDIHNSISHITNVHYELQSLGESAWHLGLTQLGDNLIDISKVLKKHKEFISNAIGLHVTQQYEDAQQSMANTLKACLNTITLAEGEPE